MRTPRLGEAVHSPMTGVPLTGNLAGQGRGPTLPLQGPGSPVSTALGAGLTCPARQTCGLASNSLCADGRTASPTPTQQPVGGARGRHESPGAAATAEGEARNAACPRPILMPTPAFRETQLTLGRSQAARIPVPALSFMPALTPWASPLNSPCLRFCIHEMRIVPVSHLCPLRASSRGVPMQLASLMPRLH